jgi:hypothetical protein
MVRIPPPDKERRPERLDEVCAALAFALGCDG